MDKTGRKQRKTAFTGSLSGPPCGVPSVLGETIPSTIMPASRYRRIRRSTRPSPIFFKNFSKSMSTTNLRPSATYCLAALPHCYASYPLPVRQASALPSASSRFAIARDTLAVRLTLPLAGRVADFHRLVCAPCRVHQQKNPLFLTGFALLWTLLDCVLVEAAGVEPASENLPLQLLRT